MWPPARVHETHYPQPSTAAFPVHADHYEYVGERTPGSEQVSIFMAAFIGVLAAIVTVFLHQVIARFGGLTRRIGKWHPKVCASSSFCIWL